MPSQIVISKIKSLPRSLYACSTQTKEGVWGGQIGNYVGIGYKARFTHELR